jgi:hypothetical protein
MEVLELVDQLGPLTSFQVGKMLFWGEETTKGHPRGLPAAPKAANAVCLSRLKDHGFLKGERWPIDKRLLAFHEVNALTKEGADFLSDHRRRNGDLRPLFWTAKESTKSILHAHHRWLIAEIFANLVGAFRQQGGVLRLALGEDQLKSHIYTGQTYLNDIEPDGLLIMQFGSRLATFLIEADTGSQSVDRFELKIDKYGDYLKNRFAIDPFFAGFDRPRVLVVTEKPGRVEHLKEATLKKGGLKSYWFSCLEWTTPPEHLATEPVWLVPTIDGFGQLQLYD